MLMRSKNANKKYIILITDGQPNAATAEEAEKQDPYKDKKGSIYSTYWDHMIDAFKSMDWKRKEELGASHALTEALMCRDKDIKISTLLITQQDQQGEWLAKRIATIGRGRYYKVKTPESLPIDALNTGARVGGSRDQAKIKRGETEPRPFMRVINVFFLNPYAPLRNSLTLFGVALTGPWKVLLP
jgi:hypothetical protein